MGYQSINELQKMAYFFSYYFFWVSYTSRNIFLQLFAANLNLKFKLNSFLKYIKHTNK